MLKQIFELFSLLTPEQRMQFYLLQLLVILMAFAEIIGVASIGPFMALIGNLDILNQDNLLATIYKNSGYDDPLDFVILTGIFSLCTLSIAALISMLTTWRLSVFGSRIGTELANRLFEYYMHKEWLFHASGTSSLLMKKVAADTSNITGLIIRPLLNMNAKLIFILFITIPMFIFSPMVALTGISIFTAAYACIFYFVRKTLKKNGQVISEATGKRYSAMSEGFGGIKDTLLLNKQSTFVNRFTMPGDDYAISLSTNQTLAQIPRYALEVVAFACIVALVIYLVQIHGGNLGAILPSLAVYALAGFKLLPAFQNIYASAASIKSGIPIFEIIKQDLLDSQTQPYHSSAKHHTEESPIILKDKIAAENISFNYPGKDIPAINQLNLEIKANTVVGIVGATGSGKSTIVDLLLGLIKPQQGRICVDGVPITEKNTANWQQSLGYVPQSIFLSNSTIIENIAFGEPKENIDSARAIKAAELSHLNDFIDQLPDGIETLVGERGVQLSGGQRQRIGIARALYYNSDILILDEATSALDGITEKIIMDAIHDFSGEKTIIMIAHRFTTVQQCDFIYMMDHGEIVDCGTYDELINKNDMFKRMASHT